MFSRLNIRGKLILALGGAVALAFVLASATLEIYQHLTLKDRARDVMQPYAELVSAGTEAAVAFEDPVRAQEILDTLRTNPQILGSAIVLEDGRVLAHFSRPADTHTPPPAHPADGVYIGADTAVLQQSLVHGARLYLVISLEPLHAPTREALWLLSAAAVTLLFISLVELLLLQRTIVRPVGALTDAAERIRAGADYDHRVPAAGSDEVARLGRSFNAMIEAVRDRERDVRRIAALQRTIVDSAAYGIISTTPEGLVTSFNVAAERLLGFTAEEVVDKQTPALWHDPEEVRARARQLSQESGVAIDPGFEAFVARARRGPADENEWTFIRKDGTRVPVLLSVTALRDETGETTGFVGLFIDLTERKQAERQRAEHVHFLESMDRVNRAIQNASDLEAMQSEVLDVVLSVFDCDRAFLMYPCDPDAAVWRVPMERSVPAYPGVNRLGLEVPMDSDVAQTLRLLLAADGPVKFGPGTPHALPADVSERFGFKCFMSMAIHPKVGKPWQFGIHQCSYARTWTAEEERLFQEIGRRLADSMTTLLAYRDLRDNREKLEEAQRIAQIGYWDRDFVANRIELAEEACRIFGLDPRDRVLSIDSWHERWLSLIHPEDRDKAAQAFAAAMRGGAPYNVDYRVVRPDGETRFIHSEANVTRDASGRPVRMLGMMQDVTDRTRAEEALRISQGRFGELFNKAAIPLCLVNKDGGALDVNTRFLETFGFSRVEIPTLNEWWRLAYPDAEYRKRAQAVYDATLQRALASKTDLEPIEYRVTCKSGDVRTMVVWGSAVGEDLLLTFFDVTERKKAEDGIRALAQQLEVRVAERTAQLEAANQELEAFAYSVSHDLRAPLRHIDGFVALLARRLAGSVDDQARHFMTTISDAVKRMETLIEDLLSFSRMGRKEMSRQKVDLGALVQEVIREFEPETRERTVHWQPAALPAVAGDRAMLRVAFVNLVANALKFTRPRPVAEIEIGFRQKPDETVFFIRDNGVGFDPQYSDKLFGVFQRLHGAAEFEGTGIGLANVRRIITRHGGRTWAEGKVNEGATFYFSLPASSI